MENTVKNSVNNISEIRSNKTRRHLNEIYIKDFVVKKRTHLKYTCQVIRKKGICLALFPRQKLKTVTLAVSLLLVDTPSLVYMERNPGIL